MGNQRVGSHFSTAAANPHVRRQEQCGGKGTQEVFDENDRWSWLTC